MKRPIALTLGGILICAAALAGLSQQLLHVQANTSPGAWRGTVSLPAGSASTATATTQTGATATTPAGPQVATQIIQGGDPGSPTGPSGLTVQNDDHVATVRWQPSDDSSTVGYKVTWGLTGSLTHSFFTPYTVGQIQPLDDGQTYHVQVQAVNGNGGLSAPIGPATAHTDPTYVNQLRQTMNGLFDDFNSNPYSGEIDPTQWYTSFNNASPRSMGFVFDAQHHLHLFLENNYTNGDDDRGSMTMRALRPFDFTNRTGTVAFDFDWARPLEARGGESARYQWYLVLSPTEVDDINYDATNHGTYPTDAFEVFMDRDQVHFRKVQGGQIVQEWSGGLGDRSINVRKHSMLKISQNSASLSIDGTTVLSASGLNLDFQKAWVYNQQFQYNLPKDHIPFALSHWDNIGFDAPAGYAPDVLHEYTDGNSVETDRHDIPASWTINIPDSLSGAKAERLFLDARNFGNVDASGTVTVNGVAVPWPNLGLDDNVAFDARVLNLPVGTLHTGTNTVNVGGSGLAIQNVHAEVAFPAGSTAPYTPAPWPMAGSDPMAMIPAVGPEADFGSQIPGDGTTVTGKIPVEVIAKGAYALLPTGHVDAVTKVSVDIDGAPVVEYVLPAPTVRTDQVLMLDTSKLSNGKHTLTVTAYGSDKNADGSLASLSTSSEILLDYDTPANNARTITVTGASGPIASAPTATPSLASVASPTPTSVPAAPTPTLASIWRGVAARVSA